MTSAAIKKAVCAFEEPLNALDGIAGALDLIGQSSEMNPSDRRGLAWIAEHLKASSEDLRGLFNTLHAEVCGATNEATP